MSDEDHDIIWGCDAIAREINRSRRQTFYLLETGRIPAQRVGRLWCASRQALRRHFGSTAAIQKSAAHA